jgi:hypothetical protein
MVVHDILPVADPPTISGYVIKANDAVRAQRQTQAHQNSTQCAHARMRACSPPLVSVRARGHPFGVAAAGAGTIA